MATKQELIDFLEEMVFRPAENNPRADKTIGKKVRCARMRLNAKCKDAKAVEKYFWKALKTEGGISSYTRLHDINSPTFEDVREEFKRLCGRT